MCNMKHECVCGKNKQFDDCCGKYLSGKEQAKTPEQLMRLVVMENICLKPGTRPWQKI